MQNKVLKIIFIIGIFLIILNVFPNIVFSSEDGVIEEWKTAESITVDSTTDDGKTVTGDWLTAAEKFLNASGSPSIEDSKLKGVSDDIYNMLSSIGMIISVVVGLILGITFMMASADDKAKVKEALIPYLVGCFVIFGAFGIWKIVINTFNGI